MAGRMQEVFDKALTDPKYAEFKRREVVGVVKETKKVVTQIKNVITETKKDIKANDKKIQTLASRLVTLDANNDGTVDNPANSSEFTTKKAQLKTAELERKNLKNTLSAAETDLKRETGRLAIQNGVLTKLDSITGVTSNTLIKGEGGAGGGKGDNKNESGSLPKDLTYTFNAPAVQSAYFTANSITANSSLAGATGMKPSKMTDALVDSFKFGGNRGAIQMNPDTAVHLRQELKKYKKVKYDTTAYGFRFHYNPTSIEMTYGQMTDVAPEAMRDDSKKFNAITPLNVGGISFTLYLNRLEDMNYVQEDGTLFDSKGNAIASRDLYGVDVPRKDIKQIYKKGTMYDLEYLFRAVHSGSNDYNSALRGRTSDIGWLVGVAVDLHLGDGLRYTVRINGLSVNHAVFNERMVPILSTVVVSCSRFYDFPGIVAKNAGGGGGGGRFGTALVE
jgi:hypothetical protein